jgi:hypothetical protein
MRNINKVPTLSTNGFIEQLGPKVDRLLAYFFTNDYSQSTVYHGRIASLRYLTAMYGSNPESLRGHIGSTLEKYLGRYFDKVEVRIELRNTEGGPYNVVLDIDIIQDDKRHSVGKEISIINSKVLEIFDKMNRGV